MSTKTAMKNIKYYNYQKLAAMNRYKYNFGVNVIAEVTGVYYTQLPTCINNIIELFE